MKNKDRINKVLQIIANILYINQHKINDTGILTGNMGIAIFLYHYARYCGCNAYEELADEFMDNIIRNRTSEVFYPNFLEGTSGLAWGFNYLIKNKFIEVEDDNILDDLENSLIRKLTVRNTVKQTRDIDFFGIGLYYMSKLNRGLICEKDITIINILLNKYQTMINKNKYQSAFDIKYYNFLLYFLSEITKKNIKEKKVDSLLSVIRDILLKQIDFSIYSNEDVYILQKNIEQVCLLTKKKEKWHLLYSKLPYKTLSDLSCFCWQNFIYFSYKNTTNLPFDEIDVFIEKKLDNLLDSDFLLSNKLLNIGLGLLCNIR